MNVYELLKQDHQRVRDIFSQMEKTGRDQASEREQLFQKLREELLAHAHAEQRIFYSQLRDKEQTHDIVEEGIHEHEQVEQMLTKIDNVAADSPEWLDQLKELKQAVEHHVQEEEGEMFPKAQTLINGAAADDMGNQIQQAETEEKQKLH